MAPSARGIFQCARHFGVRFRRAESHRDIFWAKNTTKPRLEEQGQIQGWKGPFTDNYGMNKLDRNMLCVRGIRTATEGKQAPPAQEAFRHFPTRLGQPGRFPRKEGLAQAISFEQPLFHESREFATGRHQTNS